MNIAFDAQPLIDAQKTGIGFCQAGLTESIVHLYPQNQYELLFFCYKAEQEKTARLAHWVSNRVSLRKCKWFPGSLYRLLWNFIPIPYRWFFGKKAQITHFFNYHVPPGVSGKKIATVHDMCYKAFPDTVRFKTKIMLAMSLKKSCKRADKIITDSQFSKNEIIKYLHIDPDQIIVVPCGVDCVNFRPNTDKQKADEVKQKHNITRSYFFYLGTLEPRKNIERFIKAYALLKQKKADIPLLVLSGRKGWMYESIFQLVLQLQLQNDVIFTGYVEDKEAPILLSDAVAFIFPSLYEGFGMPPLEAMACGTPVLTSNSSSLPEVVGDAAILVDPYSVDQIAAGMERLATDSDLRKELSKKGLERAKQFTWERSATMLMAIYQSLVEEQDKT